MKDNEIIKTEDLIFDYTVFDENGDETGKNRILTDINLSIEKGLSLIHISEPTRPY